MSKENLVGFIVAGCAVGIAGLIMIFSSVNFGSSLAESWLMEQGGTDTARYHLIIESYIHNFLVAGGILLSFGLLLVAWSIVRLITILNEKRDTQG